MLHKHRHLSFGQDSITVDVVLFEKPIEGSDSDWGSSLVFEDHVEKLTGLLLTQGSAIVVIILVKYPVDCIYQRILLFGKYHVFFRLSIRVHSLLNIVLSAPARHLYRDIILSILNDRGDGP